MNPLPAFSDTYAEAREKFLAGAQRLGMVVESLEHPHARGSQGETLAADVAEFGTGRHERLLLLSSGVHGIEGFCGSGVQVALLDDPAFIAMVRTSGCDLLLLHAVNPFGFSHQKRVNEDNVDVNRNFRDFSRVIPPNTAYAEIHEYVVPQEWPPSPSGEASLANYVRTRGSAAFQAAVSAGQHQYPDGLFYGGTRPAWSNRVVRDVLRRRASHRRQLAWIDLHTGLGPFGHGEKIYAGLPDAACMARTRGMFGADVTSFHEGSSASAALTGIAQSAIPDECPDVEYSGIGLEFGTQPLEQVFTALRAEQWLHRHQDAADEVRRSIWHSMREAFYPGREDWRAMVYGQARAACVQALRGLATAEAGSP